LAPPTLEVADLFRLYGEAYRSAHCLSRPQRRAMVAIELCRTAALGGHLQQCDHCGRLHPRYNSCRNRHCPKCQGLERAQWLEQRRRDLLPVPYFHVVFTVPDTLRGLFRANQELLYSLLFRAGQKALQQLAADPQHLGARIGMVAVLHTWTQTLLFHPHIHVIVPAGGLSPEGDRWVSARSSFLVPIPALRSLYRGKFLAGLKTLYHSGELRLPRPLAELEDPVRFASFCTDHYAKKWVVYAKPPFAGPDHVLRYLARYTHRIALSNQRLVGLEEDQVRFRYKDRSEDPTWKTMSLPAQELIRRFLLHVLPHRFVRIRHYGLLASRNRRADLERCRALLAAPAPEPAPERSSESWQQRLLRLTGFDATLCPACRKGHLRPVRPLPCRGFPLRRRVPVQTRAPP